MTLDPPSPTSQRKVITKDPFLRILLCFVSRSERSPYTPVDNDSDGDDDTKRPCVTAVLLRIRGRGYRLDEMTVRINPMTLLYSYGSVYFRTVSVDASIFVKILKTTKRKKKRERRRRRTEE